MPCCRTVCNVSLHRFRKDFGVMGSVKAWIFKKWGDSPPSLHHLSASPCPSCTAWIFLVDFWWIFFWGPQLALESSRIRSSVLHRTKTNSTGHHRKPFSRMLKGLLVVDFPNGFLTMDLWRALGRGFYVGRLLDFAELLADFWRWILLWIFCEFQIL